MNVKEKEEEVSATKKSKFDFNKKLASTQNKIKL